MNVFDSIMNARKLLKDVKEITIFMGVFLMIFRYVPGDLMKLQIFCF